MTLTAPPIRSPISDEDENIELPWLRFFDQMYNGDAGNEWSPNFDNLAFVGSPTITGRYYRLTRYILYFTITVTPGTHTTSTVGTTFVDNLPILPSGNGVCMSVSNNIGGSLGMVVASSNRIYTPGWSELTTPVTVLGIVEAR